jgi:RNase P subunit RPR2
MKKAITLAILTVMFAGVLPLSGAASPPKAKPVTCPVCHMPLSSKKTAADPVAMRLKKGGKIYYCCSKCKMPASMLVKQTPPKKK